MGSQPSSNALWSGFRVSRRSSKTTVQTNPTFAVVSPMLSLERVLGHPDGHAPALLSVRLISITADAVAHRDDTAVPVGIGNDKGPITLAVFPNLHDLIWITQSLPSHGRTESMLKCLAHVFGQAAKYLWNWSRVGLNRGGECSRDNSGHGDRGTICAYHETCSRRFGGSASLRVRLIKWQGASR